MVRKPMQQIELAKADGIDLTNSERKPDETWDAMEPIKKGKQNGTTSKSNRR